MKKISLIACIGPNYEMGSNNSMCYNIKEWNQYFYDKTVGKTVVMGRKTFDGFKVPLQNRSNYVISSQYINAHVPNIGCKRFNDRLAFWNFLIEQTESTEDEVIVIGGSSIFQQTIQIAETLYLFIVHNGMTFVDKWFPNISEKEWKIVSVQNRQESKSIYAEKSIYYSIVEYKRLTVEDKLEIDRKKIKSNYLSATLEERQQEIFDKIVKAAEYIRNKQIGITSRCVNNELTTNDDVKVYIDYRQKIAELNTLHFEDVRSKMIPTKIQSDETSKVEKMPKGVYMKLSDF